MRVAGGRGWWSVVLVLVLVLMVTPGEAFFTREEEPGARQVVDALTRMAQALEAQERHTSLYERVALLEDDLRSRAEMEGRLEAEVLELQTKIPALEEEIKTIPEMRKELAEFEAKVEKIVQDYEAKLSTLASEVIRLKKQGKDLQTLSDGSSGVQLRRAPSCPEVGQGLVPQRVGEQCLYFALPATRNWTAAHDHCQELGGELAAPQDLLPLKSFLHQAFTRGPSLWLGASYDLDDRNEDEREAHVSTAVRDMKGDGNSSRSEENESEESAEDLEETDDADLSITGIHHSPASEFSSPVDRLLAEGINDLGGDLSGFVMSERLREILDQPAMFRDDSRAAQGLLSVLRRKLRSRSDVPNKSQAQLSLEEALSQSLREASVVDFILLSDHADLGSPHQHHLPEHSNLEERSVSCNSSGSPEVPETAPSDAAQEALGEERAAHGEVVVAPIPEVEVPKTPGKVRMQCMLLQQKESLEYELIGRPCDELYNYICDFKLIFDTLIHE